MTASSDVAFLDVKWLKIVLCVSAKGCLTNGITSKIPWYLYQQEILLVLFAMESMKVVVMQQFDKTNINLFISITSCLDVRQKI